MAIDLLEAGVDRSTIALWLGHASVVSTEPYTVLATAMARGTGRCATTLRWR